MFSILLHPQKRIKLENRIGIFGAGLQFVHGGYLVSLLQIIWHP